MTSTPLSIPEDLTPETVFLDNRSVQCAVGIIRVARLLQSLPAGTTVEVWSRDRFAPYEIPIRVANDGHAIIEQEQTGTWPRKYWRFLIRRGDLKADSAQT